MTDSWNVKLTGPWELSATGFGVQDQKVMWHATSFEERLAQALASQEAIPERYKLLVNVMEWTSCITVVYDV